MSNGKDHKRPIKKDPDPSEENDFDEPDPYPDKPEDSEEMKKWRRKFRKCLANALREEGFTEDEIFEWFRDFVATAIYTRSALISLIIGILDFWGRIRKI